MPFTREYNPRRRWIMTATMWGVLLAALSLAAVISRSPAGAAVALGGGHSMGEVTIDLPVGWQVTRDDVMFIRRRTIATESAESGSRTVTVEIESDSDRFLSDLVIEQLLARGVNETRFYSEDFPIGPLDGVMIGGNRGGAGWRRRSDVGGVAVAVARLPSRNILRLEMISRDLDRGDLALLRRIAESVQLRAAPPETTRPAED